MDLARRDEYLRDLQHAHELDREYRDVRAVLLDAVVRGERAVNGEDQEEKLDLVERKIIRNIRIIFDLEYVLKVEFGL